MARGVWKLEFACLVFEVLKYSNIADNICIDSIYIGTRGLKESFGGVFWDPVQDTRYLSVVKVAYGSDIHWKKEADTMVQHKLVKSFKALQKSNMDFENFYIISQNDVPQKDVVFSP